MNLHDVDDIPSDNGTADSPTSSGSSSDDAVNNPAARVYFGRLQSPEKKLAVKANRRRKLRTSFVQSPLRRSSRLSTTSVENRIASPLKQSSDEVEDDSGEGFNIRQGTPEREIDVHEGDIQSRPADESCFILVIFLRARAAVCTSPEDFASTRQPFPSTAYAFF